ncbi:hypothetical protein [Streptomyces californicus]
MAAQISSLNCVEPASQRLNLPEVILVVVVVVLTASISLSGTSPLVFCITIGNAGIFAARFGQRGHRSFHTSRRAPDGVA